MKFDMTCTRCGLVQKNEDARHWSRVKVTLLETQEVVRDMLCDDCTTKLGDFMDGAR